jgi:hypothetical protein
VANLPYITAPGNIDRALSGIKTAAVPERVSQDFVKTILKIPGGSGNQMTSFLKKLGMTNNDGSPSDLYKRFRNPTSSGSAIAAAMKAAYAPLYVRNEFMHKLSDGQLLGLVVEETGQAHDAGAVKLIVNSIKHLKVFADFDRKGGQDEPVVAKPDTVIQPPSPPLALPSSKREGAQFGLNLGYTINLNLPATADPAVFDAIFRSLKEHLLSDADA